MKSYIYIAVMILGITSISAQDLTSKGAVSFSGSFLYSYNSTTGDGDYSYKKLTFDGDCSYFIIKNLEIGLKTQITYDEYGPISHNGPDFYEIDRGYAFGPAAAYYYGNASSKPFVFASFLYNNSSSNVSVNLEFNTLTFGLGYLIPLNDYLAFTPLAQYSIRNNNLYDYADSKTFAIGAQLKMFL